MKFSKWHGLGNDFVIAEVGKNPGFDFKAMAEHLCDRHFGIGGDGVVTIRPLGGVAFEMRIYNSDGTETEMCGNATRCVGLYIAKHKLALGNCFELHTLAGIVRPQVLEGGKARVDMGEPHLLRGEIPVAGDPKADAAKLEIQIPGKSFEAVGVSMGNPHAVIFVPDIQEIELENWGPQIECHPLFPRKTNVEFVEVLDPRTVRMRVWERGCGVTLACGTGSSATCVAGVISGRTERRVTVILDGGQLEIEYSQADNHVYMSGPATEVFQGEYTEVR